MRYLNSELIRGKIDFTDISSLEREKRVDTAASIVRPAEAQLWSDNAESEDASLRANTWTQAIGECSYVVALWYFECILTRAHIFM